jgi:hypothetical protein
MGASNLKDAADQVDDTSFLGCVARERGVIVNGRRTRGHNTSCVIGGARQPILVHDALVVGGDLGQLSDIGQGPDRLLPNPVAHLEDLLPVPGERIVGGLPFRRGLFRPLKSPGGGG